MRDKFNFDLVIKKLKQVKADVPKVVAVATVQYFLRENFDKQQFEGNKWVGVKRQSKKGGSRRNRSATLVQSGRLRRAVANSIKQATFDKIILRTSDVPYAGVHNDGLMAGRGAGFRMPTRKFMGHGTGVRKMQIKIITTFVDKIWRA